MGPVTMDISCLWSAYCRLFSFADGYYSVFGFGYFVQLKYETLTHGKVSLLAKLSSIVHEKMIRGYLSSDEDDYDDYDFGYSDPFIKNKTEVLPEVLHEVQNREFKEKLESALEESKLLKLFSDAVNNGDIAVLEELISLGVDVDSSAPQEWTPLMNACVLGKFEVVQFLLEHGSDPNKHKELFTPLMACCTHTLVTEDLKLNCVRLLLQHGAEVNAKDKYRTTALMYATGSGYEDIVTELLGVPGISVNLQDKEGWTALFYAVNHNNISLVEKLISAGTDLTLKDKLERTALSLALDRDLKEVANLLGYVEEDCPEPQPKEKELRSRFLDELPDSEGNGGFYSDAQNFLTAFNQFKCESISLPDLLNAADEDLYKIGVKLQPDRLKILSKGIHRFHLYPWKKSSIHELVKGMSLRMENVIAITGTVARHLTVINATLRYLNTRISAREEKDLKDLSVEKEMINVLVDAYTVAEKLNVLLPKILKHAQQIKPEISPDYIHPHTKKTVGKRVKLFCFVLGAGAAALLIRYCRTSHYFGVTVSPFIK